MVHIMEYKACAKIIQNMWRPYVSFDGQKKVLQSNSKLSIHSFQGKSIFKDR